MILHGHLPDRLMDTCLIWQIKDKKGNISDKDNYRPIAITCASSKILELVILEQFGQYFETNSNQFGFKKGHATDMCVFVMKEVINFYGSLSSPVYSCMLDSSKAFDRVNHFHLFSKLLKRNMPKLLIRLLYVWYRTQTFVVKWNNILSKPFNVINGVRQGGVLSPKLFNVFIEDLSNLLCAQKIGCYMNNTCVNHLNYADDAVLLAPTPFALQKLIDICDKFACVNDMMYNVKKSFCLAFVPKMYGKLHLPYLHLGNAPLQWVSENKYLGVCISSSCKDDADINRQIQAIYARGNVIVRNFSKCSDNVKIELFKTYCCNMYVSHLWCSYTSVTYRRIQVAYNNIFRILMNIRRGESVSQGYVLRNVDGFKAVLRKAIYGFYQRATSSSNSLVSTVMSSTYFMYGSKIFANWNKLLYTRSLLL